MSKYAELLAQDEKKVEAAAIQDRVATAQLECGRAKLEAQRFIGSISAQLNAAKRSKDFNPENIIALSRQLEAAKSDLKDIESLEKEMF